MSRIEVVAVLVHYRTPDRVAGAAAALCAEAEHARCAIDVVVVDHSGDAPVGEAWRTIRPIDNLGYAGGFNAAVRSRSHADYYLLINPDVELEPGALRRLLEHGEPDGAVGPMLYWDREYRLLQPPTREPEAPWWLRALHAIAPGMARDLRRRRWRNHARRHWRARGPLPTRHLSGACLLIGGSALDRVGPMDERYRLYYEETDWLRRLWATGGRSRLIPAARAVHEFDASASQEARREQWFARSEALYRRRYGVKADLPEAQGETLPPWPREVHVSSSAVWLELSPFASGVPAAAERIETPSRNVIDWAAPQEVGARIEGFVLTLVDETGRELGRYRWSASA